MDTVNANQDGKFAKMVKRIWNGPEEENAPESEKNSPGAAESVSMSRRTESPAQPGRQDGGRSVQPPYATPGGRDFKPGAGDTTVISKGTSITGDIRSDGDVEMLGTVMGNIAAKGNVSVNGRQTGSVQGANIDLSSCTVQGNLSASEEVSIDSASVVVGDVKSGNLTVDGKLQGNIHVMGNVNCQGNAVVVGDITSTTIVVSSGAKLRGKMQISDGDIEQIKLPEAGSGKPEKPAEQPSGEKD